ncbi:helix-turn-helix domain-containing protein [Chryseobacterium sp. S90]|uniref:helix-turn-helix domain-containing protein n=1 Tax=Chryseobacterium sp. S90 TaxID=3395373 RepID=UPI0039BC33ED
MVFISPAKAQRKLAQSIRDRRLVLELTQEGLAERSGVALSTLRKYEQKGIISLDSFIKLLSVVGGLEELINSLEPNKTNFKTIDDVLKVDENAVTRQRGRKK